MAKFFADGHLRFLEGEWRDDNGDVVEIVPVVHGRWIDAYKGLSACKCTVCGAVYETETQYCPNCGARMDGDGDGSIRR